MTVRKNLTLADIAALAQVSESTASRALRDNPVINAQTRQKVQQIAADHQFKVNATARSLRTQKSHTIAVIILFDAKTQQSITDPFLLDILGVIADELTRQGYDMLLSTSKTTDKDWRSYYFDSKRADGLIVIGQGEHDERVEQLSNAGVPFVVWGAPTGSEAFAVIGSDNRQGAELAVSHLLAQGCKRIAFLGDIAHPEAGLRHAGYLRAHREAGVLPVLDQRHGHRRLVREAGHDLFHIGVDLIRQRGAVVGRRHSLHRLRPAGRGHACLPRRSARSAKCR